MKPKTLMLLCVAVGCGLVAMIGVQQALNKPQGNQVQSVRILQAITDINAGDPLSEENVAFKEIPIDVAPADSVLRPEDYAMRSLTVSLLKGDYITKAKLSEKGVIGKSAQIPMGARIFTINVDETQNASNMLNPGDKVDVVVTFDSRGTRGVETKSVTLLERVDVFAVQDQTKSDRMRTADGAAIKARQISLVVTPEEMNWLALAKRKGQLELTLRHPLDDSRQTSKTATEQLLADLRGLDRGNDRPEVPGPPSATDSSQDGTNTEEKQTGKPDLNSFLNAASSVLAKIPTPPAPEVTSAPAEDKPKWEVKVYKGNEIQSYPFETTEADKNGKPALPTESVKEPAKAVTTAAGEFLKKMGLSLTDQIRISQSQSL